MKNLTYLFFLILTFAANAQDRQFAKIDGQLFVQPKAVLKINKRPIKLSPKGEFTYEGFSAKFYDFTYAGLAWSVYVEPGKSISIKVPQKGYEHISFQGDFVAENNFLKQISQLNQKLGKYLRKNWVKLHRQDQKKFLSKIDSLKSLFLKPLKQPAQNLSANFTNLFAADIHFSLNSFVLRYPEAHFNYTRKKVQLNKQSLEYLQNTPIDQPSFMVLPSYYKFTQRWINFRLAQVTNQMPSATHSAHKKMQVIFEQLPRLFKNQELLDYWLTENFYQHLEKNAIVNGKQYLKKFNKVCKTPKYKNKINGYYAKQLSKLTDHTVKVYKVKGGFSLEAHIFYPKGFDKKRKLPAIAIFHGGGWSKGTPIWAFGNAQSYAKRGAIGIAVQYRLSNFNDITPVESLQDTKDFFRWVRTNADKLGVLPNKIAAEGWSAGGHLVTSAALFSNRQATINGAPNALVLKSPALTTVDSWFKVVLGDKKIAPVKLSPVDNISSQHKMPPTLILQGNVDTVTPMKFAQEFQTKMTKNQYKCDLEVFKGYGHMFTPAHINDQGWPQPDPKIVKKAQQKANQFLAQLGYLKK